MLLDQMIAADVATALRTAGHDVVRVSELGMARADDSEILALAQREGRVLVTLDEHFGDWAVLPLSSNPGVIRLKVNPATSASIRMLLMAFLEQHAAACFDSLLVIVSSRGIRWVRTA